VAQKDALGFVPSFSSHRVLGSMRRKGSGSAPHQLACCGAHSAFSARSPPLGPPVQTRTSAARRGAPRKGGIQGAATCPCSQSPFLAARRGVEAQVLAECGLPLAHLTRRTLERTRRQERREEDVEGQGGAGRGTCMRGSATRSGSGLCAPSMPPSPTPWQGPGSRGGVELQAPWPVWRRGSARAKGPRGQDATAGAPAVPRGRAPARAWSCRSCCSD